MLYLHPMKLFQDFLVLRYGFGAEFEHIAEHDRLVLGRGRVKILEGGGHTRGIRIVGIDETRITNYGHSNVFIQDFVESHLYIVFFGGFRNNYSYVTIGNSFVVERSIEPHRRIVGNDAIDDIFARSRCYGRIGWKSDLQRQQICRTLSKFRLADLTAN